MNELENEEIKFNTICKEWLAFKKNKVKQSTYLNYKFIINKHLQSNFGDKTLEYFKLETLQPLMINGTVIQGFTLGFIILTLLISKRKQSIG